MLDLNDYLIGYDEATSEIKAIINRLCSPYYQYNAQLHGVFIQIKMAFTLISGDVRKEFLKELYPQLGAIVTDFDNHLIAMQNEGIEVQDFRDQLATISNQLDQIITYSILHPDDPLQKDLHLEPFPYIIPRFKPLFFKKNMEIIHV